jgi:ribonuclease BN (tRNA processing enzyme)
MKFRVLGCHGGEAPGFRATAFLIDDVFAVDAGGIVGALPITAQARLEAVALSHIHLDHMKDLAMVADNTFALRRSPLDVYGAETTVKHLKRHLFNDRLWPDFTRIPSPSRPTVRLHPIPLEKDVRIGRLTIRAIQVFHTVESVAFLVSDGDGTIAVSGDTGPTTRLWEVVNATDNLRAILVECSFPNALQEVADLSGHFTPQTLKIELEKIADHDVPIFVYHLKPPFYGEVARELRGIGRRLRILKLADEFRF